MTAGFKFFKSTDSGAPVLNNAAGALLGVLDWALDISDPVNGWQKVYTGTNKAAYRPRVGLRYYVRFDDPAGMTTYTRGYESMTDVDTGVDPFPLLTQFTLTQHAITRTQSNVATARAYWGIKTARYLLLCISGLGSASSDNYVWAFGELPTIHTGENYPFIIGGNGTGIAQTGQASGLFGATNVTSVLGGGNTAPSNSGFSAPIIWARTPSGAIKAVGGGIRVAGGTQYSLTDGSRVALTRADAMYGTTQAGPGAASGLQTPRSYIPHLWSTAAALQAATWSVGDVFAMPDYNAAASFMWLGSCNGCNIILETTDTAGSM
jgi:hypothetical protein